MANAIRVVVPSPGQRTTGILHQAPGARAGVLLLEDPGAGGPLARAVCAEAALYLHAAGLDTLSLRLPPGTDSSTRASQIVGGVRVLHALHDGKIVLISTAPPSLSPASISAETLSSFIEVASRQSRSLPDVVHVVRELTAAIRDVADSVVGVALIFAQARPSHLRPPLHTHEQHTHERRHHPARVPTFRRADLSLPTAPNSLSSLLLPLPPAGVVAGNPRLFAQVVSRLYLWSLSLACPENAQPAARSPLHSARPTTPSFRADSIVSRSHAAVARTDWRARLRWADEQWNIVLQALTQRDPTRGALARAAAIPAGYRRGYSVSAARLAWPYLDGEGRQSWLHVSSALFQQNTSYPAVSSNRASDSPYAPDAREVPTRLALASASIATI